MDCSKCAWSTDREACRACRAEQASTPESLADVRDRAQARLNELLSGKDVLKQAEDILERSHYRPDPRD